MLDPMMGRSSGEGGGGGGGGGGGDNVLIDDNVLDSLPLPPLPMRPTPRCRRHPSRPQRHVIVEFSGPWTLHPWSSSHLKEEEEANDKTTTLVEELEGKAAMAEARLRQKEEENAELKRKFEGYHVRWLQYEIRLSSLRETIDEQMISLQVAQECVEKRSREMLSVYDRQESSESHVKMSKETSARLPHGSRHYASIAHGTCMEFRQQSQALVESREPWQPSTQGGNSIDDLKKLKSKFCMWKKDYKARLRKAMAAELDLEGRHRSICWI
uniref:Uncharacterized protein n=1 Tax=Oryza meridionalis TaxID=40149 RepID=A0A0E0CFY6_9ORYZ